MPVSRLRVSLLCATLLCALGSVARADEALTADVGTTLGVKIPSDFAGLSFEKSSALPKIFSKDSQILSLIHLLGSAGSIRVGGDTSDRGAIPSEGQIRNLGEFMAQIPNWSLIYGLNLKSGVPAKVAEEAKSVADAVRNPLYFQLGNEPDAYGRSGAGQPAKPAYDVNKYISQWLAMQAQIKSVVPGAKFMGPDVATDTQWFEQVLASPVGADLSGATQHFYELGPAGRPNVTINNLLALQATFENGPARAEVQEAARDHLSVRISEYNTVFGGGQGGVSDVAASAAWGLATMMKFAQTGVVGINVHGGDGGSYSPQIRKEDGSYRPTPIFYALLMFSRIQGGRMLPVKTNHPDQAMSFLATKNADGSTDVLVVNKDSSKPASVALNVPGAWSKASALDLRTPACSSTDVTLGGAAIGNNGTWTPQYQPVAKAANLVHLSVSPCGAELINFR